MSQRLPPLNALRTFEAVARLNSFTRAADELHVTRAAVSHQIKNLEEYLGFTLIERHSRSISLTNAAEVALPKLREGFNNLSDAVHLMQTQGSFENINVWMAPSFASKWLVPRLNKFSKLYPGIDMRISGDAKLVDTVQEERRSMEDLFRSSDVDLIIRFGRGNHPGCKVTKLFSVEAVPLCSPKLLVDSEYPLDKPEDLQFHTLLHDDTDYEGHPSWEKWLKKANVAGVDTQRGLHFNHVSLAMEAAIDAQGVLLSIKALAKYDIKSKRLCIPFNMSIPLDATYYIIQPEAVDSNRHAIDLFVEWLIEEARLDTLDA
ncbi:MAG: Transcriptional regulator, LysR family [uncultured Thiotrichaceae bacterium]|uniref:Transcriptional regulator, LysR family n=1 Tax=uncultured Thiotrichaceae bacterium TaxID=298394 RepID=A0A6S6TUB7_9GAMM|nr:MAG: Transcriptional regulator, LysR family [uncultured Thiotrichaceae bacterium]